MTMLKLRVIRQSLTLRLTRCQVCCVFIQLVYILCFFFFKIFCIFILILQFNSLYLQLYACYVYCIHLLIYTHVIQVLYSKMRLFQFQLMQGQTEEAWCTPLHSHSTYCLHCTHFHHYLHCHYLLCYYLHPWLSSTYARLCYDTQSYVC